jgi:hypothetical protein
MRYLTSKDPEMRQHAVFHRQRSLIGLKLRMDNDWPPAGTIRDVGRFGVSDDVYIDSDDLAPVSGAELFRELERIRVMLSKGDREASV